MQIKRTGTKGIKHLKTDNFALENVENFNYLGSILNAGNKIYIEIAERIIKGNKAYYANAKLIKSKFLKRNTKMKIYKTIIRPVLRTHQRLGPEQQKMKTIYAFLKGNH